MKKTIIIILAVILPDCFIFCQPSNRFIKEQEAWASKYIQDTAVIIGIAEYKDPIVSHILAITDAVQKYLGEYAIVSISGKEHVNDFESDNQIGFEYVAQINYDLLDIFVDKSERYYAAVKFDDNGRYNVVMRISQKENDTTESIDSRFMMSGADKAEMYEIYMNSMAKMSIQMATT